MKKLFLVITISMLWVNIAIAQVQNRNYWQCQQGLGSAIIQNAVCQQQLLELKDKIKKLEAKLNKLKPESKNPVSKPNR
jgi:hypothetical protein